MTVASIGRPLVRMPIWTVGWSDAIIQGSRRRRTARPGEAGRRAGRLRILREFGPCRARNRSFCPAFQLPRVREKGRAGCHARRVRRDGDLRSSLLRRAATRSERRRRQRRSRSSSAVYYWPWALRGTARTLQCVGATAVQTAVQTTTFDLDGERFVLPDFDGYGLANVAPTIIKLL